MMACRLWTPCFREVIGESNRSAELHKYSDQHTWGSAWAMAISHITLFLHIFILPNSSQVQRQRQSNVGLMV
jgi:hypothetical protein